MNRTLLASLVLALLGLLVAGGTAHAQTTDVRPIVQALIAGEDAHQVDAVVALFADDATVQLVPDHLVGKAQIRVWQQGLADGHFQAVVGPPQIEGNHAFWSGYVVLDRFKALGLAKLDGHWDLHFTGNKIQSFVFTLTPESLASLLAATAAATPGMPRTGAPAGPDAALAGLAALALLSLGGLFRRRARVSALEHL